MKKTVKNVVYVFMLCFMLLLLGSGEAVFAGETSDYEYTENADGTLTITKYVGEDKNVKVPSKINGKKVVSLGYLSFSDSNIESITISEGIQSLAGESIFSCENLKWISLPNSYNVDVSIGGLGRFCVGCSKLEKFKVKSNHSTLKVLDGVLFSKDGKYLLKYPDGKTDKEYIIPKGTTVIYDDSFAYTRALEKVTMPDTVTYIGYWAFNNCNNLKEVNISNICESIGQFAFQSTAITSIHIPASVEWIMTYCFSGCWDLKTITVDDKNKYYYAKDGVLYVDCTDYKAEEIVTDKQLVCYPAKKATEVFYIPDDITSIQPMAISNAYDLKEVHIPESVRTIGSDGFYTCTFLEKVFFPFTIQNIENYCFSNVNNVSIYGYENTCIEKACKEGVIRGHEFTFISLGKYKEIKIKVKEPTTLSAKKDGKSISNDLIKWKTENKKVATVKDGVVTPLAEGTAIIKGEYEDYTFVYKVQVKSESISKAKVTLSKNNYNYNGKAKTPAVTVVLGDKKLVKDTDYVVSYKNNKNIGTAKVTIKGKGAYKGTVSKTFKIKAKKGVTFTSSSYRYKITSSSTVAFIGLNNTESTKVTIPKTVKYGGKKFTITAIADKALKGKTKVTKVTIGENVKKIGKQAFYGCKKLKTITIKSKKLITVGKDALKGIHAKATMKVPKNKLKAYQKLLKKKGQGNQVKIQ